MLSKTKDPKVSFIEGSTDILSTITSYFPDYEPDGNVVCPFHEDTQHSLHISIDGQMYCHGCKETASDLIEFIAKMEDLPYEETKAMLYNDIVDAVPDAMVETTHALLFKNPAAMGYLLSKKRHLTLPILKEFQIGYESASNRILIPLRDQFGACYNVRRMGWQTTHDKKALNLKGKGEVRLYPENKMVLERRVLLVEGEFDCLVGRSLGLPTVTWTGGASNWNDKYTHMFRDKAVWILYDNDDPGRQGALSVQRSLRNVAAYSMILAPLGKKKHSDLSDWSVTNKPAIKKLKMVIKAYRFPKHEVRRCYCPTCGGEIK